MITKFQRNDKKSFLLYFSLIQIFFNRIFNAFDDNINIGLKVQIHDELQSSWMWTVYTGDSVPVGTNLTWGHSKRLPGTATAWTPPLTPPCSSCRQTEAPAAESQWSAADRRGCGRLPAEERLSEELATAAGWQQGANNVRLTAAGCQHWVNGSRLTTAGYSVLTAGAAVTYEAQCGEEHVNEIHRAGIVNLSVHLHLSGRDTLVTEVLSVASRGAHEQPIRADVPECWRHIWISWGRRRSRQRWVWSSPLSMETSHRRNTVRTRTTFIIEV